jgi:hypothetical protein
MTIVRIESVTVDCVDSSDWVGKRGATLRMQRVLIPRDTQPTLQAVVLASLTIAGCVLGLEDYFLLY